MNKLYVPPHIRPFQVELSCREGAIYFSPGCVLELSDLEWSEFQKTMPMLADKVRLLAVEKKEPVKILVKEEEEPCNIEKNKEKKDKAIWKKGK